MTTRTEPSTGPPIEPANPAETTPSAPKRRSLSPVVVGAVLAAIVAGVLVARILVSAFSPHLYAGTVLQGDTPAPAMNDLTFARTGEPVDVTAQEGKVVLVFFGYTNCPDVCPAAMATAAQAVDGLDADDKDNAEVWMISVDPDRDNPESLQSYVEFFNESFDGVTGTTDAIDQVATGYGVFYELEPTAAEGADDYLVDHTASMFGIGPDGSLRIVWPPTATAEQIRADIEALL